MIHYSKEDIEKACITADDVYNYRSNTGASMSEALKHFMDIYRFNQKAEMISLIESGTPEDILEIVKILVNDY